MSTIIRENGSTEEFIKKYGSNPWLDKRIKDGVPYPHLHGVNRLYIPAEEHIDSCDVCAPKFKSIHPGYKAGDCPEFEKIYDACDALVILRD